MQHHEFPISSQEAQVLLAKMEGLSSRQAQIVVRLIEALKQGADEEAAVRRHFGALASEAFAKTWDNPYDAAYDDL